MHNVLDACISTTWACGRGLGPGNVEFLGPKIALPYRLSSISQGPKKSQFPGPNPLHLALEMDMHAVIYQSVPLCTLQFAVVSIKFWMGGGWRVGGGEARGPSWRGRIRGGRGGVGLARAGWLSYFMHLSRPSRAIKLLYEPAQVFWAPNGTRLSARCYFTGPKKLSIYRAQPPPTCCCKWCCPHQIHYARGRIYHKCINS